MADFTIDLGDPEQVGPGGPGHWLCPVCHRPDGSHATIFHVRPAVTRRFHVDEEEEPIAGLDDELARAALDRRKRGPPKT
jgi:hypothetical protein